MPGDLFLKHTVPIFTSGSLKILANYVFISIEYTFLYELFSLFILLVNFLGTVLVCIAWCISLFYMLSYADEICVSMKI
jgi:hypothetical protein